MKAKILIIEKTEHMKNYLINILESNDFEIISAKNGLDGYLKLRNQFPDLIIMDLEVDRLNSIDFLEKKISYKGTKDIPLIVLYSSVDKNKIIQLSKFNILKMIHKQLDLNELFTTISYIYDTEITINSTPCIIDIYNNKNEILIVEISKGLDFRKISNIDEQIENYLTYERIKPDKIILFMKEINNQIDFKTLSMLLISKIKYKLNYYVNNICILTEIEFIKKFFENDNIYENIKVTADYNQAVIYLTENNHIETESIKDSTQSITKNDKKYQIAVIDDDLLILEYIKTIFSKSGWDIKTYNEGGLFLNDISMNKPDLILLDLMMPNMNGFEVLDHLNNTHVNVPVIILSAMSDKTTILKAAKNNIKSFIMKPATAEVIFNKVGEILKK